MTTQSSHHRCSTLLGAVMLVLTGCGGRSQDQPGAGATSGEPCNPPHFEDPGVQAALEPSIMTMGVENVTVAGLKNVTSLAGVECLTGLESLRIDDGTLTDLTPLATLTKLRSVEIYRVPVTDASPLAGLTNLLQVALSETALTDLGPLADLQNLVSLSVVLSPVSDLSPLRGLSGLMVLYAKDSQVDSLEPLVDVPLLVQIEVSHTPLTRIAALGRPSTASSCPTLRALETSLDTESVTTTIPDLCALGWDVRWSEPGGETSSCGPPCEVHP